MAASESSLTKPYVFRGAAHVVTIGLSGGQLVVSVEERVTGNQWKGAFSAADVEELTEKTGHFENFADFVLLLKSALTQSSEAVTLDLLTLSDLKLLHSSRAGGQTTSAAAVATDSANRKRFLLLIRSVGPSSTIKYPLRLRFADPVNLQDTIRQLQEENIKLKQQRKKDYILNELETLKRDYDRLLKEKEEVENEFVEYRREMETSLARRGGSSSQEIQILKDFIKALEKDLAEDQRIIAKRKDQYRKVLVELDEVKARERNLQVRVKSLTNELAQYKRRGSRAYPGSLNNPRPVNSNSRNSSQTSARNLSAGLRYNSSRDSSGLSSDRSHNRASRSRIIPNHSLSARDRSSSRESSRNRMDSRERSLSKDRFRSPNTSGGSYRMKSPSPSGNRTPRFNPTAFQADKLRRQRESELQKKRQINKKLVGGDAGKSTRSGFSARSEFGANDREFRRSRTPSIESIHSVRSSIESLSDIPFPSDASQAQNKSSRETGRAEAIREQNGHMLPPRTGKVRITGKVLSSTPDTSQRTRSRLRPSNKENQVTDGSNTHSATKSREISELDERLSRIQQFLLENDIK